METAIATNEIWGSIFVYGILAIFTAISLYLFFKFTSWAMEDAVARGKSPFLVFIAVVFFFPYGWIAWLLFRPDVKR